MCQRPLTCFLVDVQTALSLSALRIPGQSPDDVERASIQARDGHAAVRGVVLNVRARTQLVHGQRVLHRVSDMRPGYSDAVIAGRGGGGDLRRRQHCGGRGRGQ